MAKDLAGFIDEGKSAFHAVRGIVSTLEDSGFRSLDEREPWNLEPAQGYFVLRNDSSLVAFRTGKDLGGQMVFRLAGAHTDSPALKWKFSSHRDKKGYRTFGTEVYGGPILSSWIDRDLGVAGRIFVRTESGILANTVESESPLGTVPNLAIHMNREVNKGFEYNRETHLQVLSGLDETTGLLDYFGAKDGFDPESVIAADLFFHDWAKAAVIGSEYLSSGRIDNLAMCHAVLESLIAAESGAQTQLAVLFDNEEIGSRTPQGADSGFLDTVLRRIILETGGSEVDFLRAKARSFFVSADGAHALHPNFPDKHDADYAPVLNQGPVIKEGATYRYATDGKSAAPIIALAKDLEIPLQRLINRSDVPSGSTIGSMTAALSGIRTVDLGNPMLAMHSIRETTGLRDHDYMINLITSFYGNNELF